MEKICIDLTNIVPGSGGAGGGIATYAKNLALGMDDILHHGAGDVKIIVIAHPEFIKDLKTENLEIVPRVVNNQSFLARTYWLQVSLPLFLKKNGVTLLHRVVPELPVIKVARYAMTLHDFMFDYYLENENLKKYLSRKNLLKFYFLRSVMRISVTRHDLILVPSETIEEELRKRFSHKTLNISVTKLATSQSKMERKADRRQVTDTVDLGFVAGFYPHKGHLHAIGLMKQFIEAGRHDIRLYFRGSKVYADYYEEVRERIRQESLEDVIFFESYDPAITQQGIYDRYDATLLLSGYEGFGLPVLESQAFSKPVICSDIRIFRENLSDSAIYVSQVPTQDQVKDLLDKLDNGDYLAGLVEKGTANNAKFSWQKTCQETFNSYLN